IETDKLLTEAEESEVKAFKQYSMKFQKCLTPGLTRPDLDSEFKI
ncbi:14450_t:CDS:1, partial [Cetraspora pellucida]